MEGYIKSDSNNVTMLISTWALLVPLCIWHWPESNPASSSPPGKVGTAVPVSGKGE